MSVILTDLDDTVANWCIEFDEMLDAWGPQAANIPRSDCRKAFDLNEGLTEAEQFIVKMIMNHEGFYARLKPIPSALEALRDMLDEGHEVFIVTSPWFTNKTCLQDKADWVLLYLGEEWRDRLIITKDKTMIHGDYLFDDKPEIKGANPNPSWEHIVFDRGHNQHIEGKQRLYDWDEWMDVIPAPRDEKISEPTLTGGFVVGQEFGNWFNKVESPPPYIISKSEDVKYIDAENMKKLKDIADFESEIKWKGYPEVRITSETGGQKGSKIEQFSSLDPHALLKVAEVAGFGAQKYAKLNFMKGYDWSLSYDAVQRHLNAFWNGEDRDTESGLLHLAHAAWHCLAMISYVERGLGTDDRYSSMEIANLQTRSLT